MTSGDGFSAGGDGSSGGGSEGSSVAGGGVSIVGGGTGSLVAGGGASVAGDGSLVVCGGGVFEVAGEEGSSEAGVVDLALTGWPVAISRIRSGREVTRPARPSRMLLTLSSSTPSSVATWSSTCSSASGRELSTASSIERTMGLWASFNQVRNETST
ncbi:MAG TPA: hypothetical protein VIZ59_05205, partial [Rubrobacteraceae bacterium]